MQSNSLKIQVLVSTMHQKDYALLEKMNIKTDAVVVNQCDDDSKHSFEFNGNSVLWINSKERGLSKSRNLAIKNATADICLLADDDMVYLDDYPEKIIESFKKYPQTHLIAFTVRGIEKVFKTYSEKSHSVGYLSSMKISSVEIAFRRKSFVENNITFDELIGSGTEFKMGEENSLLFSCLRKRFNIRFDPKLIADLHIGESTWFNGYTEEYFIGRGAAFTSMSRLFSFLLILQFAVRKYKRYKKDCSFIKAIKMMNEGKKRYITRLREDKAYRAVLCDEEFKGRS